jgi:hypothetical protein
MSSATAWETLRTFAAQAAETSAPATATCVVVTGGLRGRIEIRGRLSPETSNLTTANAPTDVVLTVWRSSAGRVDKLGTVTYPVTANACTAAVPFSSTQAFGDAYWVTAGFTGGASPTLTGIVEVRTLED